MEKFFNFNRVVFYFLNEQKRKNKFLQKLKKDDEWNTQLLKKMLLRVCLGIVKYNSYFLKVTTIYLLKYKCYVFDLSLHREVYLIHFVCCTNSDYSFAVCIRKIENEYFMDYLEKDKIKQ